MGLKKIIRSIFGSVEPAADRIVAALKKTELGDMVIDSIRAVDSKELTGSQKFETVVSEVAPRVLAYVQNGGVRAAQGDVEDLARQLVQSVFVEIKSAGFAKIAGALLKLLKL